MLSQQLEREILTFCTRVQAESPLFRNAAAGKLTMAHVRRYIEGLHHLVAHTPVNLRLAITESQARDRLDLADHFQKKCAEEDDHHLWAEDDIKHIDARAQADAAVQPSPSPWIDDIIAHAQEMIRQDPRLYVAYILLVEYATVVGGPALVKDLMAHCGITPEMLTVVGNHIELDKEHVREGLVEIDRLLSPDIAADCVREMHRTMQLLEGFFADVGAVH